jgi:DNA-binding response OmpR family regulator
MDTVLIADDDAGVRRLLWQTLWREDRDLVLASDGEAALRLARAMGPDLVILDVRMPGRDGRAVCAALRADAATRAIPVLLLSGLRGPRDEALGLEAGADAFVAKPFGVQDLAARVGALLGRAA